jgi:plasmid maintenance system antidote protein VapI
MAPAALLREMLRERQLTPLMLAGHCVRAEKADRHSVEGALTLIRAVLDRQPLTEETAVMIAAGTGISVQMWRNAEQLYRDGLAAGKTDVT